VLYRRTLLKAEAIVGFIALLIVELIPGKLIAIFGAANESGLYGHNAFDGTAGAEENGVKSLNSNKVPGTMN